MSPSLSSECLKQVKKYQKLKELLYDFQSQWEKVKETGKLPL